MRRILLCICLAMFLATSNAKAQTAARGDGKIGTYETFARIMADNPPRSSVEGWHGLPNPPATFPLQVKRNGGMENRILTEGQLAFVKALNPTNWENLLVPHFGWCNFGVDNWQEVPPYSQKCLSLGFEWNVIKIDMDNIVNGWVAVQCINSSQPNTRTFNYDVSPSLIHRFTVIKITGEQIYPAGGKIIYVPLLCSRTLFAPLNKIELFPSTPMLITVTVEQGLNLRTCVRGAKLGAIPFGEVITLVSYYPRADRVWGKVITKDNVTGCVAVLWRDSSMQPVYYTSWRMATVPPLP